MENVRFKDLESKLFRSMCYDNLPLDEIIIFFRKYLEYLKN